MLNERLSHKGLFLHGLQTGKPNLGSFEVPVNSQPVSYLSTLMNILVCWVPLLLSDGIPRLVSMTDRSVTSLSLCMSKRPHAHLDELLCTAPPEWWCGREGRLRSWVASLGALKLSNDSALTPYGGESSRTVPVGHQGSGSCHQRRVGLVLALLPRWQLTQWDQAAWQWHRSWYNSYSHVKTQYHPVVPVIEHHDHCWWLLWAKKEQVFPRQLNECPASCGHEAFLSPALSARSLGLAPHIGFALFLPELVESLSLGWRMLPVHTKLAPEGL